MKYDPWSDDRCTTEFIERNAEDFDLWCCENGIHHDYACDHELDYLEAHEDDFLDFALEFEEELKIDEAEKMNDLRNDK